MPTHEYNLTTSQTYCTNNSTFTFPPQLASLCILRDFGLLSLLSCVKKSRAAGCCFLGLLKYCCLLGKPDKQRHFFTFMVIVLFQYIVDTVCLQLITNQCNNKCDVAYSSSHIAAPPPPHWSKIVFNVQTCEVVIQAMMASRCK